MSAGYSSASGSESTRQNTNQQTEGSRDFFNVGTQSIAMPKYAKRGNKALFKDRAADEVMSRDFLSALLTDPYSGSGNRFADAISHSFDTQLARARTGDTSRTGVAKQGFREAGALAQAQRDSISQGIGSAIAMLSGPGADAAFQNARSVAPVTTTNRGTENFSQNTVGQMVGSGTSSGSNWGAGINLCCFIFLESYNGVLPDHVRRCRDLFCSGRRVRGYRRMSRWLVPAMRLWSFARWATNVLMVKPLTSFGGWLFGLSQHRWGWLAAPLVIFWFLFWSATAPKQEVQSSN